MLNWESLSNAKVWSISDLIFVGRSYLHNISWRQPISGYGNLSLPSVILSSFILSIQCSLGLPLFFSTVCCNNCWLKWSRNLKPNFSPVAFIRWRHTDGMCTGLWTERSWVVLPAGQKILVSFLFHFCHVNKCIYKYVTSLVFFRNSLRLGNCVIFTPSTSFVVASIFAMTTSCCLLNFSASLSHKGSRSLQWLHHGASKNETVI